MTTEEGRGPGRPPHEPTEASRKEVAALATFGVRQDEIARYLDIDPKTLRKHYRAELDRAEVQANAQVARRLFQAATEEGSIPAMIFWLKARGGWSERQRIEHSGPDGGAIPADVRITLVRPGDDDA